MDDATAFPSGFKRALLGQASGWVFRRYGFLTACLAVASLPQFAYFLYDLAASFVTVAGAVEGDPAQALDRLQGLLDSLQSGEGASPAFSLAGLLLPDRSDVVLFLISFPLVAGLLHAVLRMVRGEDATLRDVFPPLRAIPALYAALAIYLVLVVVGLCLIVPGIVVGLRAFFFPLAILEEQAGPIAALRRSAEWTRGAAWQLFIFLAFLIVLNAAGALCLLLGLLYTLPLSCVAVVLFYEKVRVREALLTRYLVPDA